MAVPSAMKSQARYRWSKHEGLGQTTARSLFSIMYRRMSVYFVSLQLTSDKIIKNTDNTTASSCGMGLVSSPRKYN